MVTLSIKVPVALRATLDAEARRQNLTRSDLVRDLLSESLGRMRAAPRPSAADLAGDLIGCVQGGPADLATNPKYLEEAIVEDAQRGRRPR